MYTYFDHAANFGSNGPHASRVVDYIIHVLTKNRYWIICTSTVRQSDVSIGTVIFLITYI